jgi:glutamate/tyrosine decarboxylase-like PLP-dependent enzyme
MKIPATGTSPAAILETLSHYRDDDVDWQGGKVFSHCYIASEEAKRLAEDAYGAFLWENGLDPTMFPSLMRLETEIVAMASSHLHGDAEVVGSFTSGGTESCMLAVKTARDWARAHRPEVERPQMIVPVTVHPAFHKAAAYLGVEAVIVPVDPTTCKADVAAVERAIGPRTILLVGSAPSYAHGVVDPIAELGQLALAHGLLLHVDGCIGGFLLPYLRRLGAEVTDFDFRVPGVTSMSMDFHKYAYTAKGASVVLYKSAELRRHQFFTWSAWPGYTLVNPTIQSSRSGGPLAATWAMLHHLGDEGYLAIAARLKEATDRIVAEVDALDDLQMIGRPEMCLLAIGSRTLSVFQLCDALKNRGWIVYPQLSVQGLPESFHLTLMPRNCDQVEAWLADLRACVAEVKACRSAETAASLRELVAGIDFDALDQAQLEGLLAMAGIGGGSLPGDMAEVNDILNTLPPGVTDRVVAAFYDQMSRYRARAHG